MLFPEHTPEELAPWMQTFLSREDGAAGMFLRELKEPPTQKEPPTTEQLAERARKALGLCVDCGEDARGFFRCASCRVKQSAERKRRRVVQLTHIFDSSRPA